jgi:hypothetical protein
MLAVLFIFFKEIIFFDMRVSQPDINAYRGIATKVIQYHSETGEVPQWNPFVFSGMPSYGSFIYMPANESKQWIYGILLSRLRFSHGMNYFVTFFTASFFMFIFLRYKGINTFVSLIISIAYALSPYFIGLINAGHNTKLLAISYIPMLFFATDYLFEKRNFLGILFTSVSIAILLWTNHPQMAYYAFIIVGLYWLYSSFLLIRSDKSKIKDVGITTVFFIIAGILAAGLVADPYLSVREYAPFSIRGEPTITLTSTAQEKTNVGWDYMTQWSFHPKELISFFAPSFYGLEGITYWGYMPFTQSTHYLGLGVLIFAVVALFFARNHITIFMGLVSLVFIIIGFGKFLPILYYPMYHLLPYFSKFRTPSMIYSILPFTIAVLSAYGINAIFSSRDLINQIAAKQKISQSLSSPKLKYIFRIAIFFAVLLAIFVLFKGTIQESLAKDGWFIKEGEAERYSPRDISQLQAIRSDMFANSIIISSLLTAGILFLIYFKLRNKINKYIFLVVVGLITVGDIWIMDKKFYHPVKSEVIEKEFEENDGVKFFKTDKSIYRIFPYEDFNTNYYSYFGIPSIGGYHPAKLGIYNDLIQNGVLNNPKVWNMLNVKYLVGSSPLNLPNLELKYSGSDKIYLNTDSAPHSWLVGKYKIIKESKKILDELTSYDFNPSEYVILEKDVNFELGGNIIGEVKTEEKKLHYISISTKSNSPAILVISEVYYPKGWRAYIDGKETEIYKTNYVLNSIYLPEGEHKIEFKFVPSTYNLSIAVSYTSGIILLTLLGIFIFKERVTWLSWFKPKS